MWGLGKSFSSARERPFLVRVSWFDTRFVSPEFQQRLEIFPDIFVGVICRGKKVQNLELEFLRPIDIPVWLQLLA